MATYVLPQVLVFQDFRSVPAAVSNPLRAHVSGPHARLVRYSHPDERALGRLGPYRRTVADSYPWPNRPARSKVDRSYTKVYAANALLRYFHCTTTGSGPRVRKAGPNRLSGQDDPAVVFRSSTVTPPHGSGVPSPRSAAFGDRDVRPGDVARVAVTAVGSSTPTVFWTYVKDVRPQETPAGVSDAVRDPANAGAQALASSVSKTGGPDNCVRILPADVRADTYDGLASGHVSETYVVTVTRSSTGGNLTTGRLRVTSASGTDDVAEVTPAAAGSPTPVGTRGLAVTFTNPTNEACTAAAAAAGVPAQDLVVGQQWTVTVSQAFTPPVLAIQLPESAPLRSVRQSFRYIIEVVRGGHTVGPAVTPRIRVTTDTGVDASGPTDLPNSAATLVPVGTLGLSVRGFNFANARKGDRYYVDVLGRFDGPYTEIELAHNLELPPPSPDTPPPVFVDGTEVELSLFIHKPDLLVPEFAAGSTSERNWTFDTESGITLRPHAQVFEETWTQDGVLRPLPLWSDPDRPDDSVIYLETRYWLSELADVVGSVDDVGDLDERISGPLHPDNPLKWGVFKALQNSNGVAVRFTAVADPDDDRAWLAVLDRLVGRDDVYGLVPLTRRRSVLESYLEHVRRQSSPEQGLWRVLWVNLAGLDQVPIVHAGSDVPGHAAPTTSDGRPAMAVIDDDPSRPGVAYTRVRFTSGNVSLLAAGVRPGDLVRCLYTTDAHGRTDYSTFVVADVDNETQLRLVSGPPAATGVPVRVEIWRQLSATEEAEAVAAAAASWGDRRVRATWPDRVGTGGTVQEGYFLNCALAGLCSGVLPHQGLTQLEVVGFDDVSRAAAKFNRAQLDHMAGRGVWVVTQDLVAGSAGSGRVHTRHAVTTGRYDDINAREEVLTRNVDAISYRFKEHFRPFIGVTNVTPAIQARLELETDNLIQALRTESATSDLGGQIIDAQVVELRPHLVFKDRYVVRINCQVPYPFNNMEIRLVI